MKSEYSKEFLEWYAICESKHDAGILWEAWKTGYKLGRNNAFARKDCPPEIFTIPKEKHTHSMKGNNEVKKR